MIFKVTDNQYGRLSYRQLGFLWLFYANQRRRDFESLQGRKLQFFSADS